MVKSVKLCIFFNNSKYCVLLYPAEKSGCLEIIVLLTQRIKVLRTVLGWSNTDIARIADCSPSHISKICTGKRVLKEGGEAALQFAQAIVSFAQEEGYADLLGQICGLDEKNLTAQEVSGWLFGFGDVTSAGTLSSGQSKQKNKAEQCGEKLDSMMELLQISNVRLSRFLNVDASLVSRFRNGKRSLQHNEQLIELMCSFFVSQMQHLSLTEEVAALTETDVADLCSIRANEKLQEWLMQSATKKKSTSRTIEYMQMFLPLTQISSEELVARIEKIADEEKQDTYWGIKGVRNAAMRLLTEAAAEGGGVVYMYADQSLQWLLEDASVLQLWYLCCAMCISRNVRIVVIHDVNRNVADMANAMQVWIPLFLTGYVTPYYCPLNRGSRFTHMLFLRPDLGAISSVHVQGAENNNYYDYITDPRKLSALHSEFKSLISHSEKLIDVFSQDGFLVYYDKLLEGARKTGLSVALLNAPSTVTMPEEVLQSLLDRGEVASIKKELILEARKSIRAVMENGTVTEFISLPDMQSVRDEKWRVCIGESMDVGEVCYTYDEYCAHINEIIRLLETQSNFHCCLLQQSPFTGMRIIVFEDRAVIIRLHAPTAAFVVRNPFFAKALAKLLTDYYSYNSIPKDKLTEKLKKHLEE